MICGVQYKEVNDDGLLISVKGKEKLLQVDHVVICAGQESNRDLWDSLHTDKSRQYFLIGGSELAAEIDAMRAIDQGTRLGLKIETSNTGDVFNQPIPWSFKIYSTARKMLMRS
mmetsp:Transcript_2802/g.3552  ORF Transcript_2802/g.3552 Transcript_2802/m.3552 type:complete len:114 (-) Transcript_2802:1694-2035(-)